MAKQFSRIGAAHHEFILRQKVFFTGSATAGSRVNISPKGLDALRILDDLTVAYLDQTGSGSETAAHLRADGRLTIMFCAFEGPPLILRLYGRGRSLPRGTPAYDALLEKTFGGEEPLGSRQIIVLDIDLVQTSCGFGVPLFDYKAERPTLARWAEAKGEQGLIDYRREKNARSMDELPTGLVPDEIDA
ncbi:pyridoxamine 5'-phosphate oxidase family protein [soil metagenome]